MQKLMTPLTAIALASFLGTASANEAAGNLQQAAVDACEQQRNELQAQAQASTKSTGGFASALMGSVKQEVEKRLDSACGEQKDADDR